MSHRYALVMGEALTDLQQVRVAGETVFREEVGGAPLNVAVGLTRLGSAVEFVTALGADAFAGRIRAFLAAEGVGVGGCVRVAAPTALAVSTFDGAEPAFAFYGSPPSYGLLRPEDLDLSLVRGAGVLYCGSIALLCPGSLAAARLAWQVDGPLRTFDPNVRMSLLDDVPGFREVVASFAATADLVKLSAADARALYDAGPDEAALALRRAGAATVVVTLGGDGALLAHAGAVVRVAGVPVRAVDTTGAGDAAMAGLMDGLLRGGVPVGLSGWRELVGVAMAVAARACEKRGGAASMPTRSALHGDDSHERGAL